MRSGVPVGYAGATTARLTRVSDYWQPLLVYVSGAPGAGKTTLAAELARRLGVVHLNRDDVLNGLRLTVARGAPVQIVQRGVPAHFGTLEHLLATGVSVVADGTMYAGEMEQSVRRLRDFAEVVNIHCWARSWRDRFFDRQRDRGATPDLMDRWEQHFAAYGRRIVDPLELACRRVDVGTDDGYDPALDDVIEAVAPSLDRREAFRFIT